MYQTLFVIGSNCFNSCRMKLNRLLFFFSKLFILGIDDKKIHFSMVDAETPAGVEPQLWNVVKKHIDVLKEPMNLLFEKNEFNNWYKKFERFQNIWLQMISDKMSIIDLIPLLKNIWVDCHWMVLNWFLDWKNSLNLKKDTVEFRILKSKLIKCFKIAHRFYYQILEYLLSEYDSRGLFPQELINMLQLKQKQKNINKQRMKLNSNKNAMKFILIVQQCLVNLGKLQHFVTIIENKTISQLTTSLFEKAERYFNFAKVILPSMGKTFQNLAHLQLELHGYTPYLYYIVRAAMARVPHNRSKLELLEFLQFKNLPTEISSCIFENDMNCSDFIPQVDFCTICLISLHLFPLTLSQSKKLDKNSLHKLKLTLWKILQVEMLNWNQIFKLIVILIGTFDLINTRKSIDEEIKIILSNYLDFILEYMAQVLRISSRLLETENFSQSFCNVNLLSITRVIICWIKSNKLVLQSAHRHKKICRSLGHYINTLIKIQKLPAPIESLKRPEREYFFEEDIELKDFTCIKSTLTDFKDNKIFDMPDIVERLSGFLSKESRMTLKDENRNRMAAILTSISRFLRQNKCLINWDPESSLYVDDNTEESLAISFSDSSSLSSIKILSSDSLSQYDESRKRHLISSDKQVKDKQTKFLTPDANANYKNSTNVIVTGSSHTALKDNSKIIYSETTKNMPNNIYKDSPNEGNRVNEMSSIDLVQSDDVIVTSTQL